jgi:hypothetical protein
MRRSHTPGEHATKHDWSAGRRALVDGGTTRARSILRDDPQLRHDRQAAARRHAADNRYGRAAAELAAVPGPVAARRMRHRGQPAQPGAVAHIHGRLAVPAHRLSREPRPGTLLAYPPNGFCVASPQGSARRSPGHEHGCRIRGTGPLRARGGPAARRASAGRPARQPASRSAARRAIRWAAGPSTTGSSPAVSAVPGAGIAGRPPRTARGGRLHHSEAAYRAAEAARPTGESG